MKKYCTWIINDTPYEDLGYLVVCIDVDGNERRAWTNAPDSEMSVNWPMYYSTAIFKILEGKAIIMESETPPTLKECVAAIRAKHIKGIL